MARPLFATQRERRESGSPLVIWFERAREVRVKSFMPSQFKSALLAFACVGLVCISVGWSPCLAQNDRTSAPSPEQSGSANPSTSSTTGEQPAQPAAATINGTVVDQSGAIVAGARVTIAPADRSPSLDVLSGTDGEFFFPRIAPGPFKLTITSAGFAPKTISGLLHSGEIQTIPQIALDVASALTEVDVGVSRIEIAEEQIKVEEGQRVLGIVPNFYVSYIPNAVPLTSKQKFKLAARSVIDPFSFLVAGASAGVEQAQGHFREYGQGAQGYAKRFGANYGDIASSTFIGGAIFPSLLKQDPRYFYKGTGSTQSRILYAIANSVICKGDNGHWQPGYSNILGSLAAGGISNIYYPADDRNGAELTFENAALGIGSNAVTNLLQEFVMRRFTPKANKHDLANQ
jgi:hypothetical protein